MMGCCDAEAAVSSTQNQGHGERVADADQLPEGGRIHVKLKGRYLTLLRIDGQLYCVDSACFHAGGPLGLGDIEEINGAMCLVCPWHQYKVDIRTGDELLQPMKFINGQMAAGDWERRPQQRAHKVQEINGGLYVILNRQPIKRASDAFAVNPSCGERVMGSGRTQ